MIAHTYAGDAAGTAAAAPSPVRIVPASIPANVAWTASSNVAYALCQWGMLVAFARLGTPEGLGQFAFALAISAPVMMFLQLQLRTVQVTDTRARFDFADYLTLRAVSSLAGLAIVVAIAAAMGIGPSGIVVAAIEPASEPITAPATDAPAQRASVSAASETAPLIISSAEGTSSRSSFCQAP